MGGSTYSRTRKQVKPSKRDPDYVLSSNWFNHIVTDDHAWNQEELRHLYDIKQIPIDKLDTVQGKTPYKAIEREQNAHDRMQDYEPINVIKQDKRYIVISGNERVIALASKGFKRIKARVYDMDKRKRLKV